jgi:hypothetical protein
MAFAPVFANCFLVARASRAEALAASWRPAARAAAYRPASSCCGDVARIEAFLLIVMRHLLEIQLTSGDVMVDLETAWRDGVVAEPGQRGLLDGSAERLRRMQSVRW